MAEILTLNAIFSSRQKRMLGVMVWDLNREEGNLHRDGKQIFGKQMYAGPC